MKYTETKLPFNLQFFADDPEDTTTEPDAKEPTTPQEDGKGTESTTDDKVDVQELLVKIATLERKANKAASEASEYRKKYKDTLSEKEQYDLEAAEKQAAHDAEFEAMKEKLAIAELKEQFTSLGYSKEQAAVAAKAQYENDTDTLFKVQSKFMKDRVEAEKQKILSELPQPNIGVGGAQVYTKEQFDKMSMADRSKLLEENEAEYHRLLNL